MNNIEIIANEALAHGLYTAEQIAEIIEKEGCLPLHTYSVWKKQYGLTVKPGERAAITTKLWKKRTKKKDKMEEEKSGNDFYLCKSFLFRQDQVEKMEEEK